MKPTRITNLGLIAYLQTQGYFPFKKEQVRAGGHFLYFFFESSPELSDEIEKYLSGKALVDAQALITQFINVKNLVRDMRSREVDHE